MGRTGAERLVELGLSVMGKKPERAIWLAIAGQKAQPSLRGLSIGGRLCAVIFSIAMASTLPW